MIDVTSAAVPPGAFEAVFLGVTGQDYVGPGNQLFPNGTPDWHIQLQGLRGVPTKVRITSDTGGVWETPFNGWNWVILVQYGAVGSADLWFETWSSRSFHVKVWYGDGSTDEADAASSIPTTNVLKAFFLGLTGEDYVGPGNQLSANGNPDWHIQLRGLRGIPTRVRILSDTGGVWEGPYSGYWVILPQYDGAGNADLWFEPFFSQSFHVIVWYGDASTDEADAL
jgi:hypothetical protein